MTNDDELTMRKLKKLEEVEREIAARKAQCKPWPEGLTADDLIELAKAERAQEFIDTYM